MATAMSLAAQCEGVVIAGTFSRHYATKVTTRRPVRSRPLRRNMNVELMRAARAKRPPLSFKDFLFSYVDEHHDAPANQR